MTGSRSWTYVLHINVDCDLAARKKRPKSVTDVPDGSHYVPFPSILISNANWTRTASGAALRGESGYDLSRRFGE